MTLKYSILTFWAVLFSIVSFCQKNTIISGSFEGAKENQVVYFDLNNGSKDSAYIKKDKTFEFKLKNISRKWDVYFIKIPSLSKGFMFPLFLKEYSKLHIDFKSDLKEKIISGDISSLEQNDFYKGLYNLQKNISLGHNNISKNKDSLELNDSKIGKNEVESYIKNWVSFHKSSPFSVAVIRLFLNKSNILRKLDSTAVKYYDALLPQAKVNNMQTQILKNELSKYNEQYAAVSTGMLAPSFIIKDTSNNIMNLNNYKGKWLLIDFWASWCGPCRENTPLLSALNLKFQSKGLEVLSISIDTDLLKWKSTILKDSMYWYQGSDMKGYLDGGVASEYGIIGVPTYFLVSPNGKISVKSIGGDVKLIEDKLDSVFNEMNFFNGNTKMP